MTTTNVDRLEERVKNIAEEIQGMYFEAGARIGAHHWRILCEKLRSALSQARQEGREERDKYWLGYIEERAKFELESSVYQIADMLKTDIDVARRKLSALTTEGK